MIAAIVAVDDNWGIGKDGDLLIKIPNDLNRFKKITDKNTVIMGRRTYESIPNVPLSDRWNIVVTRYPESINIPNKPINLIGVDLEHAISDIISNPLFNHDKSIYIAGGESVYSQLLPYCTFAFVTKIFHSFDSDTYFPNLDDSNEWSLVEEGIIREYNGYKYQYLGYLRI